MRALVTGGAGFIGSHVVDALLAAGHQVLVVDDLSTGNPAHLAPAARLEVLDIRSGPPLLRLGDSYRPQAVFHLAAQASISRSVADPARDAAINILGSLNVLELAARTGAVLVYASSAACYGNPTTLPIDEQLLPAPRSPYGASKLAVEHYTAARTATHGLCGVSLRLANVYGPRQSALGEAGVVAVFAERARTGQPVVIDGDGEQTRDFVYVGDVARAFVAAGGGPPGVYNIGTGCATSINGLWAQVEALLVAHGRRPPAPTHGPARPGDIRHSVFDCSRARQSLGWHAETRLEAGLALTLTGAS